MGSQYRHCYCLQSPLPPPPFPAASSRHCLQPPPPPQPPVASVVERGGHAPRAVLGETCVSVTFSRVLACFGRFVLWWLRLLRLSHNYNITAESLCICPTDPRIPESLRGTPVARDQWARTLCTARGSNLNCAPVPRSKGEYGDFWTTNSHCTNGTTVRNMCLRFPKHQRSPSES